MAALQARTRRRAEKVSRRGWTGFFLALAMVVALLAAGSLRAELDRCGICDQAITGGCYSVVDSVSGAKVLVCAECMRLPTVCFVCGLPAKRGFTSLPDGRVLCARDARTAVLNEEDARRICRETRGELERLLSRFLSFPDTNVSVSVVDRVHLQEIFRVVGHDCQCPNVWGYLETRERWTGSRTEHSMNLLIGLPLAAFKATCAHEFGHAWLNENLPPGRKQSLSRDSNEGFCELLAYKLMDAEGDEAQKKAILRNAYTRGQIDLYVEADRAFGFNDILDWVKNGADGRLDSHDPGRVHAVRSLRTPAASSPAAAWPVYAPASVPEELALKAVFWRQDRPQALINDRAFAAGDEAPVRVGNTNTLVRCLAIRKDAVLIRLTGSGEERELRFKEPR